VVLRCGLGSASAAPRPRLALRSAPAPRPTSGGALLRSGGGAARSLCYEYRRAREPPFGAVPGRLRLLAHFGRPRIFRCECSLRQVSKVALHIRLIPAATTWTRAARRCDGPSRVLPLRFLLILGVLCRSRIFGSGYPAGWIRNHGVWRFNSAAHSTCIFALISV